MDQESTQRMVVFKLLACSLDKPFFYHNGSKILVAFDPPHLMKNTRNNLKKYDIEVIITPFVCHIKREMKHFK